MRPLFVAVVSAAGLLALAAPGTAGDGGKKPLKKTPDVKKKSTEPIPVLGDGAARGVIVAVDAKAKSFNVRTSKGLVRVKYESLRFVDSLGATLEGMTPSKAKEEVYHTITLTDVTISKTGGFRYLIIVESLP